MNRFLTVRDPGPLTTVQDAGRPGWAHLGVPRSGAVDARALAQANRLVGNDPGAAALETTLGGVAVAVSTAMTLAVTGAVADVHVDERPAAWGEPVTLRAGQHLRVGPARTGLRSYVACAGGLAVEPTLGSRSTDTLSGIGPAPLAAGDRVPVGPAQGAPQGVDVPVAEHGGDTLRFLVGPRADWFAASALTTLTSSTYTVAPRSNRIGLRLTGPPLPRRVPTDNPGDRETGSDRELPSEGLVLGAVQVPPSGEPLVFLNDHPVTGGYPVIGVVEPAGLPRCAQLRPGDRVRLVRVDH